MLYWTTLFALLSVVRAIPERIARQTNDGVHLAITPTCGKLGGTFANANAGVITAGMKTLIAFGDSYTFGGRSDGGPLAAAVLVGTSPRAGGRATDGPIWAEDVASDLGATIKDYAVSGAVINVTLWPSEAGQSDFLHQAALFLSQNNNLTPATTLYTVFFGINDFGASSTDGNHLPQAAAELLTQIKQLAAAPTNAKNIVVLDDYGRGTHSATGDAFKQAVFSGLSTLRAQGLNVAFVDFAPLWDAVLGASPGFAAFGYDTSGSCIPNASQTDLTGECSTPLNSFYWLPGHPSKETHRIMANYVEFVLANCKA
ncbi:carbohydrate esterase family 16 protein [Mycena alexandri]|uniref:Carbohydrate esterase family 16 protein n=1 Tax=Mycena alexandri TaxID=1745969 RepID=A0AAD6SPS2_9AGAR|nr:carbohydrate esterase family 16 protein [Mycena alexandri]